MSLVYIDVDHFKQVNDRHGHARGDQTLQQVAAAIGHAGRARVDRGFRLGGDEFALLLPGSTAAQSETVLARVRTRCEQTDVMWIGGPLGQSAGIAEYRSGESVDAFVQRADAAMYTRKTAGR